MKRKMKDSKETEPDAATLETLKAESLPEVRREDTEMATGVRPDDSNAGGISGPTDTLLSPPAETSTATSAYTGNEIIPCPKCGKKFVARGMNRHINAAHGRISVASIPVIPREVVKILVGIPYHVASLRWGEHWKLDDREAEGMVDSHLLLIAKYLPDWLKQHSELYTCAFLHLMTIFGKVQIQMELEKAQKPRGETPARESKERVEHGKNPDDSRAPWVGKIVPTQGNA